MILALVNLLLISSIIYFIYQDAQQKPLRGYFFPGIVFKILAGIAVGLVYEFHYEGGDTFNIYHDAVLYSEFALQSPSLYIKLLLERDVPSHLSEYFIYSGHYRALFTSKILSFFVLITGSNYWLSSVYFSLFSFSGMWYLANIITERFPSSKGAAAIAFLFFPSVVFWSSGILKESLIMGAMSFILAFLLNNTPGLKKSFWKYIIFVILLLALLWKLKYYYLAVLLPVAITTVLVLLIHYRFKITYPKPLKLILVWIMLFMLLMAATSRLYPTLYIDDFLFFLLDTHDTIYRHSATENLIHYHNLKPSFYSLLRNLPTALFAGLFRPGIWDINAAIQVLPALENLFILISTTLALKNIGKAVSDTDKILLFSTIVYILLLAVLMAFAAPNFGTLVRYKIGFLPFLLYLVCLDNPLLKLFIKSGT